MADFKTQRIRNGLEFECICFNDRKNFSEGSFKPKKDIQIIQVQCYCFTPTAMYRQYEISRAGQSLRYDDRVNHYRHIIV